MSTLVEHPGTEVAVRPGKKKTGTSLISATLDTVAHPLRIASHCRDELREVLQHVDDVPQPNIVNLPAARFNHARMLSRVAVVREVHLGLFGMFIPPAPTTTRGDAIDMLSALFGATAKAKAESKTLLAACVSMFAPSADSVALATGLWQPISRHPVVVAIAIQKLINTAVFTPTPAEFRDRERKREDRRLAPTSWLSCCTTAIASCSHRSPRVGGCLRGCRCRCHRRDAGRMRKAVTRATRGRRRRTGEPALRGASTATRKTRGRGRANTSRP